MSYIAQYINSLNSNNRKVLTTFLTAGFPDKEKFTDTAVEMLDSGSDIFELGIPFSDPIADGPVIQKTSFSALQNNVNMEDVFEASYKIKKQSSKPLILMGYSNPILKYGTKLFCEKAKDSGVDGVIIPDIPLEEHNSFFSSAFSVLDKILLTTPVSGEERIKEIDRKSQGFLYCVSVKGTTGGENVFTKEVVENIERTYKYVNKNKMLVGFGISSPNDIEKIKTTCDGVIVASSIMKIMQKENYKIDEVLEFVSSLSKACD